jgi:hypothetical protein
MQLHSEVLKLLRYGECHNREYSLRSCACLIVLGLGCKAARHSHSIPPRESAVETDAGGVLLTKHVYTVGLLEVVCHLRVTVMTMRDRDEGSVFGCTALCISRSTTGPRNSALGPRLPPQCCDDRFLVPRSCCASIADDSLPFNSPGAASEKLFEAQIAPSGLFPGLGRALNAKGCVLVWNHVVFVLRIDGLEVRRNIDVLGCELRRAHVRERFEEVGMVRGVHVQVGC